MSILLAAPIRFCSYCSTTPKGGLVYLPALEGTESIFDIAPQTGETGGQVYLSAFLRRNGGTGLPYCLSTHGPRA